MSIEKKQLSCVCCKAYLFEEDDVVYCPVCGAPHHRECYNKLNHCALEELHGTENEYDAEMEAEKRQTASDSSNNQRNETECPRCGMKYSPNLKGCPNCGKNEFEGFGNFQTFDFLGGVPADLKLDEDITAEQAKKFVLANTHRYIPKFVTLNPKSKISWNWMAFLFPCGWFLSRKMYKYGIIVGIFSIIASILTYPLTMQMYRNGLDTATNYPEMAKQMMGILPSIGSSILLIFGLGLIFNLIIRVISGMFGDYIYKNHVISTLKEINQTSEDAEYDYRKKGGVNIFMFFIGTMLVQNIPSIIATFL